MPSVPYDRLLHQLVQAAHGPDASGATLPTRPFHASPATGPRPTWVQRTWQRLRGTAPESEATSGLSAKGPVLDALQALASAWQADGYFSTRVALQPTSPEESSWVSTFTQDAAHWVGLGLDPRGHLHYLKDIPGLETQAWEGTPVFLKWMVLAHEIAHTVLQDHPAPLVEVADHTWGAALVPALNAQLLGLGSASGHRQWFHEAFADTYGSMMVLRTSCFHPQAIQEVHLISDMRAAVHDLRRPRNYTTGQDVDPYETAPVLDRLLAQRQAWEQLPVACLADYARTLVSQIWWDRALAFTASPLQPQTRPAPYHERMVGAVLDGQGEAVWHRLADVDAALRQTWRRALDAFAQPGSEAHAVLDGARARITRPTPDRYADRVALLLPVQEAYRTVATYVQTAGLIQPHEHPEHTDLAQRFRAAQATERAHRFERASETEYVTGPSWMRRMAAQEASARPSLGQRLSLPLPKIDPSAGPSSHLTRGPGA